MRMRIFFAALCVAALPALLAPLQARAQEDLDGLFVRYGAPELCIPGDCPTKRLDLTPRFSTAVRTYTVAPPRTITVLWISTNVPVMATPGSPDVKTVHSYTKLDWPFPLTVDITLTVNGAPKTYTVIASFGPLAPTLEPVIAHHAKSFIGGGGEYELRWSAPSDTGGTPITGYKYRWQFIDDHPSQYQNPGTFDGDLIPGGASVGTYRLSEIPDGFEHRFQVAAVNAHLTGEWSNAQTAELLRAPGAVHKFNVSAGNEQLTLTWEHPFFFDSKTPATGYRARWAVDTDPLVWADPPGEAGLEIPGGAGVRTYVLGGLTNGARYRVEITATSQAGTGDDWAWKLSTPAGLPGPPQSLTVTSFSATSLALSWDAPADDGGAGIQKYRVRWAQAGTSNWLNAGGATGIDGFGTSIELPGLTTGTEYEVQVAAVNSVGAGEWSARLRGTPRGLPGIPYPVTSTISDRQIVVSWDAPVYDGGAEISGYLIRWAEGAGSTNWIDPPGAAGMSITGATTATLSNLTNGVTYEIQIAAVNSVGAGDFTSHRNNPGATPGAPSGLSVQSGVGRLALSWTAPADDGGDDITEYAVQWSEGAGSSNWSAAASTGSAALNYDVGGLKEATTYEVRVAARNDAGTGAYSSAARGVTTDFDMDVDQSGAVNWIDGVLIARHLAGMRGTALTAGLGNFASTAAVISAHINAGVLADLLNVDNANGTTIADGVMIARYYLGVTEGAALTAGMSATAHADVKTKIEALPQPQ